jgi:hypothetical protein
MGDRARVSGRRAICASFGMNAQPPPCRLRVKARGSPVTRVRVGIGTGNVIVTLRAKRILQSVVIIVLHCASGFFMTVYSALLSRYHESPLNRGARRRSVKSLTAASKTPNFAWS